MTHSVLINPFRFTPPGPPPWVAPTLVFCDGWHTLSSSFAVPNAPINTSATTINAGRYSTPNSAAARVTGSGTRRLPITIPGMVGDVMVLGFNASWQVEAAAVVIAINRGVVGIIGQDANTVARFRLEVGGGLTVLDSNGATVGTVPAPGSTWAWYDVKVNAVAAGSISVWRNGVQVINAAAGDFAGASATGNTWGLIFTDDHDSGSDNAFSTSIGEVMVGYGATADRWGEHRGYLMLPNGIDTAGAFAANAGTLVTAVDEQQHNDDTDYDFSSTPNDEFLLTHGDIPAGVNVSALKHISLVKRTTGASTVQLAMKPVAQATIYRPAFTLLTTYTALDHTLQLNPNTGLPWTVADVNAIKAGAKLGAVAGDLRVTTSIMQALVRL